MTVLLKGYNKLFDTVKKTIATYRMFQPGDSVLICVSGGPDSVALLHLLSLSAPEIPCTLGIAHLNHLLRGKDSDNDAAFVGSLAELLNIKCYIGKKDVRAYQLEHKLSMEEAARDVRYSFYDDIAKKNGFNKIALGHHADDNAELVLMYLIRGSGPLGISGIPPVRKSGNSDACIVRPLIDATRSEIMSFLKTEKLQYVFDKSNSDMKYLRNRMRHELIPLLKNSYNPKIVETLNRLSLIVRSEENWLEKKTASILADSVVSVKDDKIVLSATKIKEINPAAQRRVIRKAIAGVKGDLRRITFSHINSASGLLESRRFSASIDLPDRIRISRDDNFFCITKEKENLRHLNPNTRQIKTFPFEYAVTMPVDSSESIFVKEINMYLKISQISIDEADFMAYKGHSIAFFDMENIVFPLTLRSLRPGDRFQPLGMSGSQKVKKFFINNKIPADERSRYPVLLSKDRIIWIAGLRIADYAKVKPSTKIVLKAELILA